MRKKILNYLLPLGEFVPKMLQRKYLLLLLPYAPFFSPINLKIEQNIWFNFKSKTRGIPLSLSVNYISCRKFLCGFVQIICKPFSKMDNFYILQRIFPSNFVEPTSSYIDLKKSYCRLVKCHSCTNKYALNSYTTGKQIAPLVKKDFK